MRFFTQADQAKLDDLQHRLEVSIEATQRFAEANLRLGDEVLKHMDINLRLSSEVLRLSQRQVPAMPDGDVEQPRSVSDNDRVVLEDAERQIRPNPPRPGRVE